MSAEALRAVFFQQTMERADDAQYEMAKHFWPIIGTANQAAFMAIDDAVGSMIVSGMMIQREKWHAQQALREFHKYEHAAWAHFHEIGDDRYALWQDVIGRAAERLQPDVQKLYFAIKNVLDREGARNAVTLAHIQTGLAMVTLATLMFDTMAEQFQRRTMMPIRGQFLGGRLTAVEHHWKQVGEITGRKVIPNVNLRDDAQCQMGINVILNRYSSGDFLQISACEALELNNINVDDYEKSK